jgi:hypothetical protein
MPTTDALSMARVAHIERRRYRTRDVDSPAASVLANVATSREQLDDARENLKASRRRVVQLEDAVANWKEIAAQLPAGTAEQVEGAEVRIDDKIDELKH